VVADALSRKPGTVTTLTPSIHPRLQEEFAKLNMVLCGPVNSDTLELPQLLWKRLKRLKDQMRGYKRSRS
jgi:hypothetical protein